jgi:hypothetical protein
MERLSKVIRGRIPLKSKTTTASRFMKKSNAKLQQLVSFTLQMTAPTTRRKLCVNLETTKKLKEPLGN